ncbi:MAG: hypothetical protein KDE33_27805, partial [Bacteroidetes bacterium]|nr:hypothetical protein [Bacteroidota bacterium]
MKRVFVGLVALLIFLSILEIGLRFSGKLKTYSEKSFNVYQSPYAINANSQIYKENPFDTITINAIEYSYTYFMNNYGLNDKQNLDTQNKETTYLYLGDSFTFGAGTPQDSSVPALLSKISNCTFINAGFSGSDPFFETKLIDSIFRPLGFEKFIIMMNVSDLYDYIFRGGTERFLPNGKLQFNKAPWWEKLHQHSYIVRAFAHGILKMDFTLLPPKIMKQKKDEAVKEYAQLFIEKNKELNGNLIVVIQPYARQYSNSNQILNEVMNFNYLLELNNNLKLNHIKTINLNDSLSKIINDNNY